MRLANIKVFINMLLTKSVLGKLSAKIIKQAAMEKTRAHAPL